VLPISPAIYPSVILIMLTEVDIFPILGAGAALASALMWAISAILFRQIGDSMSATAMNFGKGVVALVCLGIFLLFSGFGETEASNIIYLALSGLVGICIGDTLYFMSLTRLGARVTLLIGTLIPVVTGVAAVILLGEQLTMNAWLGIFITLSGVAYVLWERVPSGCDPIQWRSGLLYGVLFILANAAAILLTKIGVEGVPALEATFIRQVWAVVGLTFFGLMTQQLITWHRPLKQKKRLKQFILAAVIGAFLGTWLSVVAVKYTHVAIAATLNSTSPLFVLPLAVWFFKERISSRAVVGAFIACLGIAFYFFSLT